MCFEELVLKIAPKLKGITHRLNGRFTFFNDDDLYQEALIHLWQDWTADKLSDKTDSYILQGCYFYLKNYIRKACDKMSLVSLDMLINDEGDDLAEILSVGSQDDYLKHIDDRILSDRLNSLELTVREKDVLFLCVEGLTVREIGSRLGISHVRVVKLKSKIQDKCAKFKEEIKQGYQK